MSSGTPPAWKRRANVRVNDIVSRLDAITGTLRGLPNRVRAKQGPTDLEIQQLAIASLQVAEALETFYQSIIELNQGKPPRARFVDGSIVALPMTIREYLNVLHHDGVSADHSLDN